MLNESVSKVKPAPSPSYTDNWTDPLNRLIWQQAFKTRATEMTLRDGRKFRIEYETHKGQEVAWVRIAEGWIANAACGWFNVKRVLDPNWVSSTD